eukprot:403340603
MMKIGKRSPTHSQKQSRQSEIKTNVTIQFSDITNKQSGKTSNTDVQQPSNFNHPAQKHHFQHYPSQKLQSTNATTTNNQNSHFISSSTSTSGQNLNFQMKKSPSKNFSNSQVQTNLQKQYQHQSNKSTSSLHSLNSGQVGNSIQQQQFANGIQNLQNHQIIKKEESLQKQQKELSQFLKEDSQQRPIHKFPGAAFQNQNRNNSKNSHSHQQQPHQSYSINNTNKNNNEFFQSQSSLEAQPQQHVFQQSIGINQIILDTLIQRQQDMEVFIQELESTKNLENKALKEKLDNVEQMMNKCVNLLFERQSQIDQKLVNQESSISQSIQLITKRIKELTSKQQKQQQSTANHTASYSYRVDQINYTSTQGSPNIDYEAKGSTNKNEKKPSNSISSNNYHSRSIQHQSSNISTQPNNKRTSGISYKKGVNTKTGVIEPINEIRGMIENRSLKKNSSFTDKRLGQQKKVQDENQNPIFKSGLMINPCANIDNRNIISMIDSSRNYKLSQKKEKNSSSSTKQYNQLSSMTKCFVPEKRIALTKDSKISNSTQELRIVSQGDENILTTNTDCFKTLEGTALLNNLQFKSGKHTDRSRKNHKLIDNYQKNVPSKLNNQKALSIQRSQTSNDNRGNQTYQNVQMPQNSLIAKTISKKDLIKSHFEYNPSPSKISMSSSSSSRDIKRASVSQCKSILGQVDDISSSPKFMGYIKKSELKTEMKFRISQTEDEMIEPSQLINTRFNIDNDQAIQLEVFAIAGNSSICDKTRNNHIKFYDTILSKEDMNDLDEGRVDTMKQENVRNDTLALNKVSANSVYQSKNMNLSRFISSNKSQIDFKNYYNKVEFRNLTEFLLQKGNRCQCTQSQFQSNDQTEICSDFCKRLQPNQEREIIKKIISSEIESNSFKDDYIRGRASPSLPNQKSSKKIIAPHSRSRSPTQRIEAQIHVGNQVANQEKKYLISAKWWRQWCDYVNFEAPTPQSNQNIFEFDTFEQDQDDLEFIDERKNLMNKFNQNKQNRASNVTKVKNSYPKPGKIINHSFDRSVETFIQLVQL